MFKRIFNKYDLANSFLKVSLFTILMYIIPITLYISAPQVDTYRVIMFERALMMIENIVCAFSLTLAFGLIIRYEERKIKMRNR